MFGRNSAERAFRELSNKTIESLRPSESFELMIEFYEDVRAKEVLPLADPGDMLLYQWGIYDWGRGSFFELNLTRQLIYSDEGDDGIYKLGLTYAYQPDDDLQRLGEGNLWFELPSHAGDAHLRVLGSDLFKQCDSRIPESVELRGEYV